MGKSREIEAILPHGKKRELQVYIQCLSRYFAFMKAETGQKDETQGNAMTINITEQSKALFLEYASDAGNWNGSPLVGGNVGGSKEDRGNLTQLKRAKLITTFSDEGCLWIVFTQTGKAFAAENGVDLSWIK